MSEHQVEPHVFVIIGATGDLTRRKLLPALYHLRDQGILETHNTLIVGAALPEMGEEGFRLWAFEGLQQAGWRNETELRVWCDECLHYQTLHEGGAQDYDALVVGGGNSALCPCFGTYSFAPAAARKGDGFVSTT